MRPTAAPCPAVPAEPGRVEGTRRLSVEPVRLIQVRGSRAQDRAPRRLPVGWPLKYLLVGFPAWWALGLNTLIFPLLAIPMLRQLRRRGGVRFPPWMWSWWLFLAWQVIGFFLVNVSPPGTHPGSVSGRLISTVFTMIEYAGVTVTVLYAGNLRRDEVSQATLARWLGWFFLSVCGGGFLGLIAPRLSFRSAIEYVLPQSIVGNGFVHALVHPVTAQVQEVIGSADPRPSAPFGYTNSWGNALSILVVWFVAAWLIPATGRRRLLYATILLATVVPVILSLNRGLWIGSAFTVVWLLARALARGRLGIVLAAFAAAALAAAVVAASPLTSVIQQRLHNGDSNDIRSFVAAKSILAIEHSPLVGYGGTRHADGSPSSIAVGKTSDCAQCGDVPTGSTGQLWALLFNNGLVGTGLYFGFFLACLWTYRRQRGALSEAALVTIALSFVYMLFYSAVPVAPTLTMLAVAVLWREHAAREDGDRAAPVTGPIRLLPARAAQ